MRRILLVIALGIVSTACDQGDGVADDPPSSTTTAVTDAFDFTRGEWRSLPAPPPGVSAFKTVWTGDALVAPLGAAGGALYEPTSRGWTPLPPSPLGALHDAAIEWTGREVVVAGGLPAEHPYNAAPIAEAAVFDPTRMTWRSLPPIPFGGRAYMPSVWTGAEVVFWGGIAQCCPIDSVVHEPQAAALDPSTGVWRSLPDLPVPWSGDDGGAVTAAVDGEILIYRDGHLVGLTDHGWTAQADPPPPGAPDSWTTAHPASWGGSIGSEIVVWTTGSAPLTGLAFDAGRRRWRRAANVEWGSEHAHFLAVTGGLAVVSTRSDHETGVPASIAVYSASEDRWIALSPPPADIGYFPSVTWTGEELLFVGGAEDGGATAPSFAFRPEKERG